MARADRIILLDLPRRVTMPRILRRVARYRGQVRPDSAPGCPERLDLAFLIYGWRWRRAVRPGIVQVLEAAGERVTRYEWAPTLERVLADLGERTGVAFDFAQAERSEGNKPRSNSRSA